MVWHARSTIDAAGCYVAVNDSLVKRHGLRHKALVIGRRPCDCCAGDFGRIPSEQDAKVLRTGRALLDHLEQQWHVPRKPVWWQPVLALTLAPSPHSQIGMLTLAGS